MRQGIHGVETYTKKKTNDKETIQNKFYIKKREKIYRKETYYGKKIYYKEKTHMDRGQIQRGDHTTKKRQAWDRDI